VGSLGSALELPRETIRIALKEKMDLGKFSRKWVPHVLTESQKLERVSSSRALLDVLETHDGLRDTITGDQAWLFFGNPWGRAMGKLCGRS
jgi:hypothetical protein